MKRSTMVRGGLVASSVVMLFLVPVVLSPFHTFVATRIVIFAFFVMALNICFGYAGMPSLGHAAFFGVGGYVVGIGLTRWGWSVGVIFTVVILSGFLLGIAVGFLTIRTEGIYLLLLTLAVGQGVWALAFQQVQLTRGDNGIAGIGREALPFGASSLESFYVFVLVVVLLGVGVMWVWVHSPVGRALVAARESKSRTEALGYRVWVYRVGAFALSGTLSAVAGMLLVYLQGIVSPEMLFWTLSAEVLVMAILGGAGTFFGPALGALVVTLLEEVVSSYTARWTTILGVVFIATMMFLPNGLTGLLSRHRDSGLLGQREPMKLDARPEEVVR